MDVMNISEELISFETAKLAKEKGFSVKCNFFFNAGSGWKLQEDSILRQCSDKDIIECPTQSLLQKWLREEHGIYVLIHLDITISWIYGIGSLHPQASYTDHYIASKYVYSTYEEALEIGLQEALKLIK